MSLFTLLILLNWRLRDCPKNILEKPVNVAPGVVSSITTRQYWKDWIEPITVTKIICCYCNSFYTQFSKHYKQSLHEILLNVCIFSNLKLPFVMQIINNYVHANVFFFWSGRDVVIKLMYLIMHSVYKLMPFYIPWYYDFYSIMSTPL